MISSNRHSSCAPETQMLLQRCLHMLGAAVDILTCPAFGCSNTPGAPPDRVHEYACANACKNAGVSASAHPATRRARPQTRSRAAAPRVRGELVEHAHSTRTHHQCQDRARCAGGAMGDTLAGSTLKVRPWPLGSATSTSATSAAARAPAIPVARENAVACGPVPVARWPMTRYQTRAGMSGSKQLS